jgi:hypothetical protein
VLNANGHGVFFQDWDFKDNFVLEMDRAHKESRCTVAVLSLDYLTSRFTAPEWAARFAEDATGAHDLLPELLISRHYTWQATILQGVRYIHGRLVRQMWLNCLSLVQVGLAQRSALCGV